MNSLATELDETFHCAGCDYDLRGLTSDRCPECGSPIDREALLVPRIPWAHRKQIGWIRAFFRTCLLAFLSPRRLAEDVRRPVSYKDARLFQNIVIAISYGSLLILEAYFCNESTQHAILGIWLRPSAIGFDSNCIGAAVVLLGGLLFFKLATGVGSYFFHPRRIPVARQNRAVALSYYACGPLVLLPLAWFDAALLDHYRTYSFEEFFGLRLFPVTYYALPAIMVVPVGAMFRTSLILMKRTTNSSGRRTCVMGIYLPLAWAACAFLTFWLLPALYNFFSMVVFSYR